MLLLNRNIVGLFLLCIKHAGNIFLLFYVLAKPLCCSCTFLKFILHILWLHNIFSRSIGIQRINIFLVVEEAITIINMNPLVRMK